ncbi:hypothetical protein [Pedobacter insulae]|uniref:Lipoprotein n=1 Tax=Pedobacter insulae TaxID=414048 RepID=A0A1I3A841_9SPHI|nr:hypothetical protein [Pedobacter insulae]SFH46085.1 hypothetical protein SAMN04489864_11367 [Pedobacter insulae]
MKTQPFLFTSLCALSLLIFGCQQEKPKEELMDKKQTVCYQAISEKDTAWLSIDTSKKIINGLLTFNYVDKKERYEGQFKGEMYGDTLRGHYDFKINKADLWNRNPVAFLKKDGKLTMGVGQFILIMGSAHFDNRIPIDYDNGRFVFSETACKN